MPSSAPLAKGVIASTIEVLHKFPHDCSVQGYIKAVKLDEEAFYLLQ